MFESIRHWLSSIGEESRLFDHRDNETVHSALASLLYHLIAAEARHDGKEKHEFDRLMKQEFGLDDEQIDHLFAAAKSSSGDMSDDLAVISEHLKSNPASRMQFMQKMLQLIDIHGIHTDELKIFYQTLHRVFPDLKETGEAPDF